MIWTLLLVSTGVTGMWLAARHWYGWAIGVGNEVLWFAYAIQRHDSALMIMAWVWGFVAARNCLLTRRDAGKV